MNNNQLHPQVQHPDNMEKIYLIKNVSPWMIDELLVFAKHSKFKLIFIRKPSEFYTKQIEELKADGIEIVIHPMKKQFNLKKIFFAIGFLLSNLGSLFSKYSFVITVKSVWWFLSLDDSHFAKPCSIHAQFATQTSILALMLTKYFKNNSIQYFFTFHAYDIFFNNKWFVKLVNNSTKCFSISNYNMVYVLSKYKGVDPSKIELNRLGTFARSIRSAKNTETDSFTIGFISWFVEKKGLTYLMEAMKMLAAEMPAIKLKLAGDGPLRMDVEKFVAENNLSAHVDYLGSIGVEGKSDFFSQIDILVLPAITLKNDMEGIPVVLMEALSYGVPIIATNISGIPEICIHDYNGILIPQKNVAAISNAIKTLYTNKEAQLRYASNSQKMFGNYNIETNSLLKLKKLQWV